ncbi:MAG: tetratricopeptide repeat protein [Planctomycetota bacterium]|jgi:tetratricopeptide (TPR) repeat protein
MPGPPHEGADRRDISKRRTAVTSGKISLESLREIAQELERANWIGSLHVSAGDSEKYIYFSVGGLRLVSTGTRKYTSLGRVLVRQGVVQQHDLAKALQAQSQSSARLGEILVRWKLATKDDLEGCVRVQVENELRDIVTWDDGEYRFSRGMPGDSFERTARATTVSLDIAEFWSSLLETAERYKEIRAKIPNLGAVLKLAPLGRAAAESPDTPVAVMEFLQAVDGKAGLQEVANRAEFGRFEVMEIAYEALRGGQVQLTGASRLAPRDSGEIKNLERALDEALNDVLIRRKLAEAYERSGETAKAVENYKQIAAEASRNYRDEEAIGALEKVSRLMPTEFGAQEQLLDAYQRTGKKAKVIEHATSRSAPRWATSTKSSAMRRRPCGSGRPPSRSSRRTRAITSSSRSTRTRFSIWTPATGSRARCWPRSVNAPSRSPESRAPPSCWSPPGPWGSCGGASTPPRPATTPWRPPRRRGWRAASTGRCWTRSSGWRTPVPYRWCGCRSTRTKRISPNGGTITSTASCGWRSSTPSGPRRPRIPSRRSTNSRRGWPT